MNFFLKLLGWIVLYYSCSAIAFVGVLIVADLSGLQGEWKHVKEGWIVMMSLAAIPGLGLGVAKAFGVRV
jgi:hypothetical protein